MDSNWDGGTSTERKSRLDAIAKRLAELDADVVVLNEVDFDASWSHSVDQAEYLAREAGYRDVAKLRNFDFCVGVWSWRFGNAVLSRYPLSRCAAVDLPSFNNWEPVLAGKKLALFCEIDVAGKSVGLVATHLSHRSEDVRLASAERLLAYADGYGKPLIIAGDLNSTPTGFPHARNSAAGITAIDRFDHSGLYQRNPSDVPTEDSQLTFRSDRPTRVIDWILVPEAFEVVDYRIELSTLSDHRPIVADIRLAE